MFRGPLKQKKLNSKAPLQAKFLKERMKENSKQHHLLIFTAPKGSAALKSQPKTILFCFLEIKKTFDKLQLKLSFWNLYMKERGFKSRPIKNI